MEAVQGLQLAEVAEAEQLVQAVLARHAGRPLVLAVANALKRWLAAPPAARAQLLAALQEPPQGEAGPEGAEVTAAAEEAADGAPRSKYVGLFVGS